MKQVLPTVTIGIAAYNEEKNIAGLLKAIMSEQSHRRFTLEKILVADDGSTDQTVQQIQRSADPRVKVLQDGARLGKAGRVDQLLQRSQSDILILLDADVEFGHRHVLDELVAPLVENSHVTLTSGAIHSHRPRSFFQRVVLTGSQLWDETCATQYGSGAYYCSGAIRALRKSFYKRLKFIRVTAEDVYPYLFQQYHQLGEFAFAPRAIMLTTLPATLHDYLSQMRRYLQAVDEQGGYFNEAFIRAQFPIGLRDRLRVLARNMVRRPVLVSAYLLLLCIARADARLHPLSSDGVWEAVTSSK